MDFSLAVDIALVKKAMSNYRAYGNNVQKRLESTTNKSLSKISLGAKQRVNSRGGRMTAGGRVLDLKSRIVIDPARLSKDRTFGVVWSKAPHSHLVEFGTKPHIVVPSGKRAKIGGDIVTGPVKHPGAKPRPFLQPAYLEERQNYLNNIKKIVWEEAERNK